MKTKFVFLLALLFGTAVFMTVISKSDTASSVQLLSQVYVYGRQAVSVKRDTLLALSVRLLLSLPVFICYEAAGFDGAIGRPGLDTINGSPR